MKNPQTAEHLLKWLQEYAARSINSQLIDERRCIPPHIVLELGKQGLFGMQIPKNYGGLALSHVNVVAIMQQLGAIDLSLATLLSTHANGLHPIQHHGSPALQRSLLPAFATGRSICAFGLTEVGAGSNPHAIETMAIPVAKNEWRLEGRKIWVDSGAWSSVMTVFVKVAGRNPNSKLMTAFAVPLDAAGVSIEEEVLTLGLRGMVQNHIALHDVIVTERQLLGEVGGGLMVAQDALTVARLLLAATSLGAMKQCLQLMHRYVARRTVATGLLLDNPVILSWLGELTAEVTAVEALVRLLAERLDAGHRDPAEVFSAAKIAATEFLWKAADLSLQALGGRGYMENNVVPRILRDARSLRLSEGPTEALNVTLGANIVNAVRAVYDFVKDVLGSRELAESLLRAATIKNRCMANPAIFPGPEEAAVWSYHLAGQVAVHTILLAAVEHQSSQSTGARDDSLNLAHSWFARQVADLSKAAETGYPLESVLTRPETIGRIIGRYTREIGECQQHAAGVEYALDPMLRPDSIGNTVPPPPLSAAERDMLLVQWNDTAAPFPHEACIHQLFEARAAETPDAVAVVFEAQPLSYAELDSRSNRLARHLKSLGIGPNMPVGICVERSLEMVIGLMGILKAGGAYVPLDPGYPEERLRFMREDAACKLVMTKRMVSEELGFSSAPLAAEESNALSPDNLAYIIYTSGSTGRPKGVEVCHRSVVNLLTSMARTPGFSANDTLVAITTLGFDIAALEIFLPLVTGAKLVIAAQDTARDPVKLASLLEAAHCTVLQGTPATYRMLLTTGWKPNGLRVLCGGEALPGDLARTLTQSGTALWNLYGPTETTIWSTLCRVDGQEPVSIGRPIANTQAYILDHRLEPLSIGIPGELFIGGAGVARGYLNQPELSAEKFIPNPFGKDRIYRTGDICRWRADGNLEYLGRTDRQVKIRGFRIELGEIEAALGSQPGVDACVVTAREDAPGDQRLAAYVVGKARSADLRRYLAQTLPDYMMPSHFVSLPAMPLTPNGKVDREALPAPGGPPSEDTYVAPRNATEELLALELSKVLRIDRIGVHDNFFALGGHSLLATLVVSRIRSVFRVEIPLKTVFETPTVASLARQIETGAASEVPSLRKVSRDGRLPLSFPQERLWFLERLQPGCAALLVPTVLRLRGALDVEALRASIETLVDRHEILRTTIAECDGQAHQIIHPPHPWVLEAQELNEAGLVPALARNTRFDLQSDWPLRTRLYRLSADEHILALTLHHVASDGWSINVLIHELCEVYAATRSHRAPALSALPVQYADYAVWQRTWLQGPALEAQLFHWKEALRDIKPLNFAADRSRPNYLSLPGGVVPVHLPSELVENLKQLSREHNVTLFMTLLAAFEVLLSRISGQEDFCVGTPVAGRRWTELEGLIGCFFNLLAMRAEVSANATFVELLARVRERALAAFANQDAPFQRVVDALRVPRDLWRSPVFQVMFDLQNTAPVPRFPDLEVELFKLPAHTAISDLTLSLGEHDGALRGGLEYPVDLFDRATVERMAEHFHVLLDAIVRSPATPISHLN